MNKSRKIFRMAAVVFLLILLIIAIDFSRRTTFPGGRKEGPSDTLGTDSVRVSTQKVMEK